MEALEIQLTLSGVVQKWVKIRRNVGVVEF